MSQLQELKSAHASLQETHNHLASEAKSASDSQGNLTVELEQLRRDSETAASKLDGLTKRADAAEKKKTALQEENGELVKQLEEVRGRVVQIMEEKVDLAGRVESLESKNKAWEREKEAQVEEISVSFCFGRVQDCPRWTGHGGES